MNLKQRITSDTPEFWKKLGFYSRIGGTTIGIIGTALITTFPIIAPILITIGSTIVALGTAYTKLATEDTSILKEEAEEEVIDSNSILSRKEKREQKRDLRRKLRVK